MSVRKLDSKLLYMVNKSIASEKPFMLDMGLQSITWIAEKRERDQH